MTSLLEIEKEFAVINKKMGKDLIHLPNSLPEASLKTISTGSIGLDFKSGIGGFPKGKISYILGEPSCGKTTLCLHLTANAQKNGDLVAFIDGEHEYDRTYARTLGVDVDNVLIVQPDSIEEALMVIEELAAFNKFGLIIFDSIASLSTNSELEGEITDLQTADKARLMSKHARRIAPLVNKMDTALVYVNQYRDDIKFGYGGGKTAPGGKAIRYRSALSLELTIIKSQITIGEKPIGSRIRGKFVKNKLAVPFTEWEFTILWGKGIVEEYDLLEIAIEMGIIEKKGAWLSYEGTNIGQGIFNTMNMLKENAEVKEKIKHEVLSTLGVNNEHN